MSIYQQLTESQNLPKNKHTYILSGEHYTSAEKLSGTLFYPKREGSDLKSIFIPISFMSRPTAGVLPLCLDTKDTPAWL